MSTSTNWTCTTRASYQCSCMLRIAVRYQRWTHVGSVMSAYAAWDHMVPVCSERWCTEANEATQTHCYNPVAPAYPVWAYYAHGRQRRCQEDPVNLPSSRLEKTTRSSPHHVAQHCPTGSEKNTTLSSPKQQIWLRTTLCGWCRRMALHNLRIA